MPQANLVGLWHFNGNSNDLSGSGLNGVDANMSYPSGKFAQSALFNGTSSVVTLPNSATLKFGTGAFTVIGWVKPRVLTNNMDWISKAAGGQAYVIVRVLDSGLALIQVYTDAGNNYNQTTASVVYTAGKWCHLSFVFGGSGSTGDIYLNGALLQSNAITGSPSTSGNSPWVFSDNAISGVFYDGELDEVGIYNKALSAKEIKDYYNWSLGRFAKIL